MTKMTTYRGIPARKMKPTKRHRPAVWEGILGAVYAMNAQRQTRYFDYDWPGALQWAGYSEDNDPRVWRFDQHVRYADDPLDNPTRGRLVLWLKD